MVHSASGPAPDPSPVVLGTLFVHSPSGLAIRHEVVVLGTIETARDRARSRPSPAPFAGPPANRGCGREPRVDSHRAGGAGRSPLAWYDSSAVRASTAAGDRQLSADPAQQSPRGPFTGFHSPVQEPDVVDRGVLPGE
jgi:hypothetical protein